MHLDELAIAPSGIANAPASMLRMYRAIVEWLGKNCAALRKEVQSAGKNHPPKVQRPVPYKFRWL